MREELARAYQPHNPEELLLLNHITRTWLRLQKYCDLESELIEKHRLSEMFENDLARFNSLQRAISGAERMWRQAVKEFHAVRRRNLPPGSLRAQRPGAPPPPRAEDRVSVASVLAAMASESVPTKNGTASQPGQNVESHPAGREDRPVSTSQKQQTKLSSSPARQPHPLPPAPSRDRQDSNASPASGPRLVRKPVGFPSEC